MQKRQTARKIAKKIIVGNWKMNPLTGKEAEKLLTNISKNIHNLKKTEVVACPPFLYTEKLKKISKKISLGAQDAFAGEIGAFTGEISAQMLYDLGARFVILGHSERRAMGEGNDLVNKKVKGAFSSGLRPILCVGESIRDENHEYLSFVKTQLIECLAGVSKNSIDKLIIAYEPVWAIGKGALREATPEEFREMSIFIKKILSDKFGVENADRIKIIYGGSVNPGNSLSFLEHGGADGFLVGRDSLDAKKFSEIIKICEASSK
jgi:triosephosphate isomerase